MESKPHNTPRRSRPPATLPDTTRRPGVPGPRRPRPDGPEDSLTWVSPRVAREFTGATLEQVAAGIRDKVVRTAKVRGGGFCIALEDVDALKTLSPQEVIP